MSTCYALGMRSRPAADTVTRLQPQAVARRWLIFVHQLPPTPSKIRVRAWRRLQDVGAIAVKQSVYVLPDTPEAREDFEWLKVEIEGAGGEAILYSADNLDSADEAGLVEQFRYARQKAYAELAADLQRVRPSASRSGSHRRRRDLVRYRERFAAIERLDFFGAAGRDRVVVLLAALEGDSRPPGKRPTAGASDDVVDVAQYRARLWVTRPRPGVDRMASAWLIRRFIDAEARFGFMTDVKTAGDAIPFDMFGGGFGHAADRCTFETLVNGFKIADPAVHRVARIVHDLDLKDGKFDPPEAPTIGVAIDGLQLSHSDDAVLLEQGMTLFEALYRSFARKKAVPRPRAVVTGTRKAGRRK
jgi:hypothetical protein